MSPTSGARPRDRRTLAALGLVAGIAVPAALLGGTQATALTAPTAPTVSASLAADANAAAVNANAAAANAAAADADDEQPVCGDPKAKDFPIETRIQDTPDQYASGGGYGTWFLDLTNTTGTSCQALHPVLVLADRDRRLTSDQIQLEFSGPGSPEKEYRVAWETTDRDEQIGVFGDPFPGVTVPAGETVSLRVRMAFTSDTAPGPVTAHAAVVQRRHQDKGKGGGREDGEWVGESEDYPFVIVDGATGGIREPDGPRTERPDPGRTAPGTGTRTDRPGDPDGPGRDPREDPGTGRDPAPDGDSCTRPPARPDAGEGDGSDCGEERPGLPARDGLGRPLPELARTGPASTAWTGAAAGVFLLAGAALLRHARRTRRTGD
ncbi:peptidase [Streptomyces sp. SH5]|uniref:peptidase n=1 Tax=Streptomyces sp. SH5 TaxID=3041765 RepID=UPI002477ECE0|nr:peptidase [Streptomyces sp. SH5]WGP10334.1 peptidase [Streptomyces sp. SH5]